MRFANAFFRVGLKACMRNVGFLVVTLLMPILVWIVLSVVLTNGDTVAIGIHLPESRAIGDRVKESFANIEGIDFEYFDTKEELQGAVASNAIVMGYEFKEHWEEQIERQDVRDLVTLYILENEVFYEYYNQIIASVIYEQCVPYLTAELLAQYEKEISVDDIRSDIGQYNASEYAFSVEILYGTHASSAEHEQDTTKALVYKIIIIGLVIQSCMIFAFCVSGGLQNTMHSMVVSPIKTKMIFVLPMYLLGFISGVIALIIAYVMLGAGVEVLLLEIMGLAICQMILFLLTLIAVAILGYEWAVLGLPFVVLGVIYFVIVIA